MALKILFLTHKYYPDIGGIETISEILANSFYNAGYDVCLVTWTKEIGKKTFPFKVIRSPGFFDLIRVHRWAELVFENNLSLRLAWPGIFFNRGWVTSLQTWITKADGSVGLQEKIKFKWLKRSKIVISCSEAIRKRCWPTSIVIGNPYQEDTFKHLENIEKKGDFLFLGRLVSDKGADLAIQAFKQLLKEQEDNSSFSSLSLTIIGDGPERDKLEKIVCDLQLTGRVFFKGALRGDVLVKSLNEHRFLLVPSMWEEPFGIVALEGMACGCVPIVSDGGGLPDAVGKAGLVFKRGDINSFVQSMLKVLKEPKLEEELRREAVMHLSTHTSVEVSRLYLDIFNGLNNSKYN